MMEQQYSNCYSTRALFIRYQIHLVSDSLCNYTKNLVCSYNIGFVFSLYRTVFILPSEWSQIAPKKWYKMYQTASEPYTQGLTNMKSNRVSSESGMVLTGPRTSFKV